MEDLIGAEWIRVVGDTYGWSLSSTHEISDILMQSPRIRENLTAAVIKSFSQRSVLWTVSNAQVYNETRGRN
jgi:hypothetical protein